MFKENYIEYRGGKISFATKGKGRAIVFLHGFLQSKEIWKKFSADFPKKYRIICIDLPAHGNSSTFGYINHMEDMADAVKAVLDSLKLRRYVMLGHSMGGYVCLAFGEKYTDNLIAMILMNTTAKADSPQRKKSRKQMAKLIRVDKEKILHQLIPTFFNVSRRKPYKRAIKKIEIMAKFMDHRAIISSIAGMKQRKEREIVVKFAPYPILYLIGEKDKILDSEILIQESKLAKKGQFDLLGNTGHMAMLESAGGARESILHFLRSIKS